MFLIILVAGFVSADFLYTDNELNCYEFNAVVIAIGRLIFGILVAILIFALHFGPWKFFDTVFFGQFWSSLAKLSFNMYLIHPVVQYTLISSRKQPIDFGVSHLVKNNKIHSVMSRTFVLFKVFNSFVDLILSFICSVFLHLLVEEPFAQASKLVALKWSYKLKV